MTKYNNRTTLSGRPSFSFRTQFFIRKQPSFSLHRSLASSSPLFSPVASSCRILADCVGASVCPVGKIRQKGRRSRGHLSQSDGTAEKYVTRENQFQRRLAPTGLAVKAIVLVLDEREEDGRVLSSAPRERRNSRGEPRAYICNSVERANFLWLRIGC